MLDPICIFEDSHYTKLYPLTLTRPVFDLRCGLTTLKEKITRQFPQSSISFLCRDDLAEVLQEQNPEAKVNRVDAERCFFINGRVLFNSQLVKLMETRQERLYLHQGQLVAAYLGGANVKKMLAISNGSFNPKELQEVARVEIEADFIEYPWDLINQNSSAIVHDFNYLNRGGEIYGQVSEQATLVNKQQIYIGQNSKIQPGVVLDAEHGAIYIGNNVTIMPNAVIEGPACVGDHSIIKIGAKIYEGTTIGEVCKVGGEVEESIIHSYSNKQHEGFLGHAYLGQWVNLGADTNNSDLKNNYGTVKVHVEGKMIDSGSQFVGLFMGDHSKTGINTMFNTGTIVGVMSNVFGGDYPPKFIPSFTWGGKDGFVAHYLEKALETARRVMKRRHVQMSPAYEKLCRHIFQITEKERKQIIQH